MSSSPSYKTEAQCLQACKEGACCEGTTCSVRPQCQCQGTGQTFKGVGTTCDPNPCGCFSPIYGQFDLSVYIPAGAMLLNFHNSGYGVVNRNAVTASASFAGNIPADGVPLILSNSLAPSELNPVLTSTKIAYVRLSRLGNMVSDCNISWTMSTTFWPSVELPGGEPNGYYTLRDYSDAAATSIGFATLNVDWTITGSLWQQTGTSTPVSFARGGQCESSCSATILHTRNADAASLKNPITNAAIGAASPVAVGSVTFTRLANPLP